MRKDILKKLQQDIYDKCQKETNKFGMGCYYHIVAVVKYVQRGMGIEDGKEFVKDKLTRSFQKLSARSKEHYRNKFEKTMEVLG